VVDCKDGLLKIEYWYEKSARRVIFEKNSIQIKGFKVTIVMLLKKQVID
jgi:hypothetical protein